MIHSLPFHKDFDFWHLSQTERDTLMNAIQFSNPNQDNDTIIDLAKFIAEHHFSNETVAILINQYAQMEFTKGFLCCESQISNIDPMSETHHLHRGAWYKKPD